MSVADTAAPAQFRLALPEMQPSIQENEAAAQLQDSEPGESSST